MQEDLAEDQFLCLMGKEPPNPTALQREHRHQLHHKQRVDATLRALQVHHGSPERTDRLEPGTGSADQRTGLPGALVGPAPPLPGASGVVEIGPHDNLEGLRSRIAQAKVLVKQQQPDAAKALLDDVGTLPNRPTSQTLELAAILQELAEIRWDLGLTKKAITAGQLALQIREAQLGSKDLAVAESLNALAKYEMVASNYTEAERFLRRAIEIRRNRLGDNHADVSQSYNSLGNLYAFRQNFQQSEANYLHSLQILERASKPDYELIAGRLNNLALLYTTQGDYAKAEIYYQRLLKTRTLGSSKEDDFSGVIYNNLAGLSLKQGNSFKAIKNLQRGLEIYRRVLPSDHPELATSLSNLGLAYLDQGLYSKAANLLEQALDIRSRSLPLDHPEVATSLNNLAVIYLEHGLLGKAEALLNRSLSIHAKKTGNSSLDTAMALHNIGLIQKKQDKLKSAENYFKRALDIRRRILGALHPEVASTLESLADTLIEEDKIQLGLILHQQALRIREQGLRPGHPDIAKSLYKIGSAYNIQSHYNKALPLFKRAESILQQTYGDQSDYPLPILPAIGEQSNSYLGLGQIDRALAVLSRAIRLQTQWLTQQLPLLSEETRKAQLQTTGGAWWKPFELVDHGPAARQLALEVRLNRHGLLQEIEQRQNRWLAAGGALQERVGQLRMLTQQLASLSLAAERRRQLQQQRDQLQTELYRALPELKIASVSVADVARALPRDGVLVEFQRFQPYDIHRPFAQRWGAPAYLALILKPDGTITTVHLGAAATLEPQLRQALHATATAAFDAQDLWAGISDRLFKPLAGQIAGARQLFLSPDGELNRIPFAALPAPSADGRLLGETVHLRLLTTGRELLSLSQPLPAQKMQSLVIANPNFNSKGHLGQPVIRQTVPTQTVSTGNDADAPSQQRAGELKAHNWALLPGTAREGQAIAALLGAKRLEQEQATAASVQQAGAPRLIHIASHGFVLPDQDQDRNADSPLLRSGIVLAGANQPDLDPNDDGYLTALEVTQLDWKATELVTLSACQSGWSLSRAGEGVYGLKRAIAVAGARSSLLSLWLVDDAATDAFMRGYYARLKAGEGRADALAAMQAEFRGHPNPLWRHPYVWAAFQLSGDWRPIPGL